MKRKISIILLCIIGLILLGLYQYENQIQENGDTQYYQIIYTLIINSENTEFLLKLTMDGTITGKQALLLTEELQNELKDSFIGIEPTKIYDKENIVIASEVISKIFKICSKFGKLNSLTMFPTQTFTNKEVLER